MVRQYYSLYRRRSANAIGVCKRKSYPCHFLPSLETGHFSSFSAALKTPEPPANAAPVSCALNTLLVMQTSLHHVHIAVARKN